MRRNAKMKSGQNKIPLNIDCHSSEKFGIINITQGVPFPDKTLERGAAVRIVDEQGAIYPTQAQCLATWGADLKYVKWLLVDAQVPGRIKNGAPLFLEYGAGLDVPAPEHPVCIRNEERRLILGNGRLEVELCRGNRAFFSEIRVKTNEGWRDLLAGGICPVLYMIDQRGNYFDSGAALPAPVITVEEEGKIRSSVCVKGWHASASGLRFCPFILRIHMYAGREDLKIFHTFIFDQEPDIFELSSIGLRLPLKLGDAQRACFGGEQGPRFAQNLPDFPEVWHNAQWLAESEHQYKIDLDGRDFGNGRRSAAWASLQGRRGSVAAALRDAYQEYPKAIRLNPDNLDIQFWPEKYGKTLAFKTPWKEPQLRAKYENELQELLKKNQTAGVNWKGFLGTADVPSSSAEGDRHSLEEAWKFTEKYLKDRPVTWGDTDTGKCFGLAKTHEFSLLFSASALDDAVMEDWALGLQTPPMAVPAPEYMCSTGAARLLSARDDKTFPKVEAELDHMIQNLLLGPVEEQRLYGMLDYGDFVNVHARTHGFLYKMVRQYPGVKFTDLAGWYNNEATDLGLTLWQYFLRNGGRKFWRAAEAYSKHQEDVDVIHADLVYPNAVGRSHGHNMLHWNGGGSPSHTNLGGWLLHYYLTGNKRAFEVARESAEVFLRVQEPCGVYSNRHGTLRREFTGPMEQLWIFYQATWEQKFLDCAKRSLDFLVAAQDPSGLWARDVYTDGERGDKARLEGGSPSLGAGNDEYLAFYDAYLVTGDERYRQALLRAADYIITKTTQKPMFKNVPGARKSTSMLYGEMATGGATVAHAYQLSGDERYLKAIRETLEEMHEDMNGWAEMLLRVPFQRAGDVPQDAHAMLAAVNLSSR